MHTFIQDYAWHLSQLEELRALLEERRAAVRSGSGDQSRQAAQLATIESAIERIDRGLYGTCRDCGTFIPLAALFQAPHEQRCPDCAHLTSTEMTA
ncbi:MAG TPA: TraR/DksA C4-type zinc finger protein [Trebonia sp.]